MHPRQPGLHLCRPLGHDTSAACHPGEVGLLKVEDGFIPKDGPFGSGSLLLAEKFGNFGHVLMFMAVPGSTLSVRPSRSIKDHAASGELKIVVLRQTSQVHLSTIHGWGR